MNRFYIQLAPELLDFQGNYVENDSLVCDQCSRKWHVSYYYENKALHIILDNEKGDYQVIKNFSHFSKNLSLGHRIPPLEPKEKITVKTSGGENEKFHVLPVLVAIGIGLAFPEAKILLLPLSASVLLVCLRFCCRFIKRMMDM